MIVRTVALLVPWQSREDGLYVYLQDRDEHAPHYPDHLGFFGGHVEPGEEPEAAMLREAVEELDFRPVGQAYVGRFVHGETAREVWAVEVEPQFEERVTVREGRGGVFLRVDEACGHPRIVPGLPESLATLRARLAGDSASGV